MTCILLTREKKRQESNTKLLRLEPRQPDSRVHMLIKVIVSSDPLNNFVETVSALLLHHCGGQPGHSPGRKNEKAVYLYE